MEIDIREIEDKDYPAVASLMINELGNNNLNDDYGDSAVLFFNRVKKDETYKTTFIRHRQRQKYSIRRIE